MEHGTVLLVEDNPDDEALILRAFDKSNIIADVVVVRDGVEALDFLFATGAFADRDVGVMPQVVVLDLKLPKIDGLEVLRRLRANERTKNLPVVILTSSDEERDILESYNLRANSYVCKPVNYARFAQAVQHLGRYWLMVNVVPPQKERQR